MPFEIIGTNERAEFVRSQDAECGYQ